MHLQRRLVGVGDGLVRLDEDHAFGQASDDLFQLRPVGSLVVHGLFHLFVSQIDALRGGPACPAGQTQRDEASCSVGRRPSGVNWSTASGSSSESSDRSC